MRWDGCTTASPRHWGFNSDTWRHLCATGIVSRSIGVPRVISVFGYWHTGTERLSTRQKGLLL